MELSETECLSLFIQSIWNPAELETIPDRFVLSYYLTRVVNYINLFFPHRYRVNIEDLVIFKNNKPFRWLFTSDKTGV